MSQALSALRAILLLFGIQRRWIGRLAEPLRSEHLDSAPARAIPSNLTGLKACHALPFATEHVITLWLVIPPALCAGCVRRAWGDK
jgi:hypothetical protein